MTDVRVVHLEGASETLYDRYARFLDAHTRHRLDRLRRPEDRVSGLCGALLARVGIAARWSLQPRDMIFTRNEYGKPELAGRPSCQFNIAHSGERVVGVFDDTAVGVDIERIEPLRPDVMNGMLAHSERAFVASRPEEERLQAFYRLWTLKESYVKARGMGLSIPPFSFEISGLGSGKLGVWDGRDRPEWHFREYVPQEGYRMAVCARKIAFPQEVDHLFWEDLLRRFESIAEPPFASI